MNGINGGILVLRACVGFVMLAHGWNHAFGGGRLPGTARWFESIGIRPGRVHAFLATATELAVGPMLIAGFLTPLAAAGVVGTMLVALIANHLKNGFFIFRPGEGYEYVLTLIAAGVCLGAIGAGEWSVDGLFDWELYGTKAVLTTVVLGAGGAALTLATSWRPPPPKAKDG